MKSRRMGVVIALIGVMLMGAIAMALQSQQGLTIAHALGCDSKSMRDMASEPFRTDLDKQNLLQAAEACEQGRTKDEAEGKTGDTTSTAPSTPAAPIAPAQTGCETRYLANDPVSSLKWDNSFRGNAKAIKPELANRDMESLTLEEALQESEYTRSLDPMLTYAEATQFGVLPYMDERGQAEKILNLATDCAERARVNAEVTRVKRNDYTAEIVELGAGKYVATFSFGGATPIVLTDYSVNRAEGFKAIRFTRKSDGHVELQRLACGFQDYEAAPAPVVSYIPQMPTPPPGIERTPEGVPSVPEKPTPTPTTTSETPPTGTTTPSTPTPTTTEPTPSSTPPPPTSHPSTTPPPPTSKVPGQGSGPNGNGGEGAGQNENSGPGSQAPHTPVPETPRIEPQPTAPAVPTGATPTSVELPTVEPNAGSTPNEGTPNMP